MTAMVTLLCLTLAFVPISGDQNVLAGTAKEIAIHENHEKLVQQVNQINEDDVAKADKEILDQHRGRGNYSCLSCHPPNCEDPTICRNAVKCFTSHIRDTSGFETRTKGCVKNRQHEMFHCATLSHDGAEIHKKNNRSAQYAFDCCRGNMCNENATFAELPPVPVFGKDEDVEASEVFNTSTILAIVIPAATIVLILGIVVICMRRNHLKRMDKLMRYPDFGANDCELAGLRAHAVGDSTLREYQAGSQEGSCEMSSGSGSGMPKLTKRTFAKDINLVDAEPISKGRWGEVWRGIWNGDEVAVKIFNTRDEASFLRETRIYCTTLMRHPNILVYYGHDTTSRYSCTQNWLVTQYHKRGSLYDYLNRPDLTLTWRQARRILCSSLRGLVHLHTAIHGTQAKLQIAHRDIKSKNILVKGDEFCEDANEEVTCVLADFGLAVTQGELPDLVLTEDANTRVGTKRYMSPELLDLSIMKKSRDIERFLKSDMYSFALVMWEVLRKTRTCDSASEVEEFALPYHTDVDSDPSFEAMKKVVCLNETRPYIPDRWHQNHLVKKACEHMAMCWHADPSARYSSARLLKSLSALEDKEEALPKI